MVAKELSNPTYGKRNNGPTNFIYFLLLKHFVLVSEPTKEFEGKKKKEYVMRVKSPLNSVW